MSPTEKQQYGLSTVMTGYLLGVASRLESTGVDSADVFKAAGLSNNLSNDPLNRFPSCLLANVFRLSAEAAKDPYFGLNTAGSMKAPDLHVVGLGLLASGSMLSFVHRLAKFLPMITGAGRMELQETEKSFRVVTRPFGPMCANGQDSWLAFLYGMMRQIHSPYLKPLGVELMHSRPSWSVDPYWEHFHAPVTFGNDACVLEFSRADMLRPLRSGCEELANVQDVSALSYLTRLNSGDMVARVQMAIIDSLREADSVSLDSVADRLRLSARQVHQRLVETHTNYQTVLDQTRHFLAKEKLNNPDVPITEIAYMLGFTDSANFSRAFKRWTGGSPRGYRNRARRQAS